MDSLHRATAKNKAQMNLITLMFAIFNVQAEKNLDDVCAAMYAVAENNGVEFYTIDDILMETAKEYGANSVEYNGIKSMMQNYDDMQEYFEDQVNTEAMGKSLLQFAGLVQYCFDFSRIKFAL